METHLRVIFFAAAVAGSFGPNVAAAQISGPVPAQLSQIPAAPTPPTSVPDLRITTPEVAAETGSQGVPFALRALHISGQTRFSEAELVAAAGFVPDRAVTLPGLRAMALRITRFYNAHGFIVAQAYVPAQKIIDGAVTIAVIEGQYGVITLKNESHLSDGTAAATIRGLNRGDPVAAARLERRLLLLSDLPGVRVRSTLSPGADVGTSDLLVDVTPGNRVTGNVEVSNAGNPYTGLYQGGGTINLNEPLGIGDVLSLRVLTSGGGLQYGRASYQAQAGNLTLGAAYAYFHYRLGKQFDALDANGSQQIGSLYAAYPLVRSYDNNLQLRGQFDYRAMRDNIDAFASVSRRRAQVLSIGLTGDHHDRFGGGGWDSYSLYLSGGNLDIRTPLVRANDAATARTNGHFGKLRFSADRLQTVAGPLSLYAGVRGQLAFNNLDVTEKMQLGGATGVRAYPEGEVYGDEGYIATAEARVMLAPINGLPGRLQVAGFYDYGQIWLNHTPWLPGDNRFTRHGAGASLTWLRNDSFLARASYAFQLGARATSYAPNSTGQFRFEIIKFFG